MLLGNLAGQDKAQAGRTDVTLGCQPSSIIFVTANTTAIANAIISTAVTDTVAIVTVTAITLATTTSRSPLSVYLTNLLSVGVNDWTIAPASSFVPVMLTRISNPRR